MSRVIKVRLSNRTDKEILLDNIVKIVHFLGKAIEFSDASEISSKKDFNNNDRFVLVMKDGTEYHCISALGIYDEEDIHLQEDAEYYCRKALSNIRQGKYSRAISDLRTSESTINRIISP